MYDLEDFIEIKHSYEEFAEHALKNLEDLGVIKLDKVFLLGNEYVCKVCTNVLYPDEEIMFNYRLIYKKSNGEIARHKTLYIEDDKIVDKDWDYYHRVEGKICPEIEIDYPKKIDFSGRYVPKNVIQMLYAQRVKDHKICSLIIYPRYLFDLLELRMFKRYLIKSKKDLVHIIRSILKGLSILHQNNIIHNDLKLGNILIGNYLIDDIKSENIQDLTVAICDLENSEFEMFGKVNDKWCNIPKLVNMTTHNVTCPNKQKGDEHFTYGSDIWSLAIELVFLCCPVSAHNYNQGINTWTTEEIKDLINRSFYDFIDSDFTEFIMYLLRENSSDIPPARICLQHKYLN